MPDQRLVVRNVLRLPQLRAVALVCCVAIPAAAREVRAQGENRREAPGRVATDADVTRAMRGFMDALNALDADRMAAFFADDITAFVPTARPDRAEGKRAVDAIFRGFVERTKPTVARLSLVPEAMQVESSPTLAVVHFQIHEGTTVRRRTFIWRSANGRWLISHFHASDVSAPPG